MLPFKFDEANTEFGPPKNWDATVLGECLIIPAFISDDPHRPGGMYVVTAWMPSEKDKEEIAKGKPIFLQVYGGQPPVSLYTVNDEGIPNFEEHELRNLALNQPAE